MPSHDLVLLGGGHSHVLLIRQLAMQPFPDTRVTLVSEQATTAYSGMLPGLIAGHYSLAETQIDLRRLCRKARVRFIQDRATGLDPDAGQLHLTHQPDLAWDSLSIDTGSTPNTADIPGASTHAVGVKPIGQFYQEWQNAVAQLTTTSSEQPHWGVVGAGAGGIELILAMAHALRKHPGRPVLHLVFTGAEVLAGYPNAVRRQAMKALDKARVRLHPEFRVRRFSDTGITGEQGQTLTLTQAFLCTPASAPDWPRASGLATARGGFIRVNNALQSTSHPAVFAAGDVAEMVDMPRPKAGVYAVRQAPWLHTNMGRFRAGEPLEELQLQNSFLSLLSLGGKRATGGRYGLTLSGRWVWRWKDRIDRAFMAKLNAFEPPMAHAMPTPPRAGSGQANANTEPMPCAGCGSKLGPEILQAALPATVTTRPDDALQPALGQAEDAAIFRPTPGCVQVQSVDGFRAFTDDLYTFGRISVVHALSDLYAMNANPSHVQVLVNLAFTHPRLQQGDFQRLMEGIGAALAQEQVALAGGHSTQGAETHLSLSVSGEADPAQLWRKTGARAGDWLVLTKPLGSGVILAAEMAALAPAEAIRAAHQSMLVSNRAARASLLPLAPRAVTDVTGFGLLGHLLEVLDASACDAELWLDPVPLLTGALALSQQSIHSTLYPGLRHLRQRCQTKEPLSEARLRLLLDPQTSGGLLAALPGDLSADDLPGTVIGRVRTQAEDRPRVHIKKHPATQADL